jgi:hypothetical protein
MNLVLRPGRGASGLVCLLFCPVLFAQQQFSLSETAVRNVSAENPLYLYSHFRDDDHTHLRLSYSHHAAIDWYDVNPAGSYSSAAMRDPSIMYVPNANPLLTGTFYFIVTPASGAKLQFFSSVDLVNFSPIITIDMSVLVPGTQVAWAPEWWHDPQDGNYYFFVALSNDPAGKTSSTALMMPYLVQFNPASAAVMSAAIPLVLYGSTQNRTFDFFPYYDGSNYYLLYVDQQPGGVGGAVVQPIAFATSPNLTGPYTQQTLQGEDYFGLGSFQTEAPTIFRLGESQCLRVVFDTWTVTAAGTRDYAPVFRDSCTNKGAVFSSASFSKGPTPLVISSEHGTIIPLTDVQTASLVYNALAAAQAGQNP